MKKILMLLSMLGLVTVLQAQTFTPSPAPQYTSEQLNQLLAPIALYPDALVALILPASTAPSDVVLASRYLDANGDPAGIDQQPWDDSVKSLAHYPEVIHWMNDNLDWTQSLGRAFALQPTEVMGSVQQLRAQARGAGTLVDTTQQKVVVEKQIIRIVPADPQIIYVPVYDPNLVYVTPTVVYREPLVAFGVPHHTGAWLFFECNWDDFGIWIGSWHPSFAYVRDWRFVPAREVAVHVWHPDALRQHQLMQVAVNRPVNIVPRPEVIRGAPVFAHRPEEQFRATVRPEVHPVFAAEAAHPASNGPRPGERSATAQSVAQQMHPAVSARPVTPPVRPVVSTKPIAPPAAQPAHVGDSHDRFGGDFGNRPPPSRDGANTNHDHGHASAGHSY